MTLNYTPLRHKMLAEIFAHVGTLGPALYCANQKRAIWRPTRFGDQGVEEKYSAAESRAVNDLWGSDLLHTPNWQGEMYVYRLLYLTDSGKSQLDAWSSQYGEPT